MAAALETVKDTSSQEEAKETADVEATLEEVIPLDPLPSEVIQQNDAEDDRLVALVNERYAERLRGMPDDLVLRFVRGYAHEEKREEETLKRIEHFLDEAEKHKMLTILDDDWELEAECAEAWPCFTYGQDTEGHPVMYDEIGTADPTKVDACFTGKLEKLRTFRFRIHQRVSNRRERLSKRHGCLIYKHTLVMDVSNVGLHTLAGSFRNLVKAGIGYEQDLFPETLHKCVIVNAPFLFRGAWAILRGFIDPLTYEKISVNGYTYETELQKYVAKDQIPPKYKGTGTLQIVVGHDAEDYADAQAAKETN